MASSPFSSSSSQIQGQVSQEEFYAFHNIDRKLFYRLVFLLHRQPYEAMQVMAFWLWLERIYKCHKYVSTFLKCEDNIVLTLFNDSLFVLKVIENDEFHVSDQTRDISLLQDVIRDKGIINLRKFHENRIDILLGVGQIQQQICLRAFQDILSQVKIPSYDLYKYPYNNIPSRARSTTSTNFPTLHVSQITDVAPSAGTGTGSSNVFMPSPYGFDQRFRQESDTNTGSSNVLMPSPYGFDQRFRQESGSSDKNLHIGEFRLPIKNPFYVENVQRDYYPTGATGSSSANFPLNEYDRDYGVGVQGDVVDLISRMRLDDISQFEDVPQVPPSERTIFLTFSKGYPISERELRDFLFRSFGDIVESLYMQEVGENEQPLYARVVVSDLMAMDAVLSGQGKSKFAINGKHVWARKYVRKNVVSPPSSPSKATFQ